MDDERLASLQKGINERQTEFQATADLLARGAEKYQRISTFSKVFLILLGALTATKAAADQIIGSSSTGSIVFYTLIGVLTAMIAGLEAALRFERRSAELTTLASDCHAFVRSVDSQWRTKVGGAPPEERVAGATELLGLQDEKLNQIQERAAKLGFNVTVGVRFLRHDDGPDRLYPA